MKTAKLEYFLTERLPSDVLTTSEDQPARPVAAGSTVIVLRELHDHTRLVQAWGYVPPLYKWLMHNEVIQ